MLVAQKVIKEVGKNRKKIKIDITKWTDYHFLSIDCTLESWYFHKSLMSMGGYWLIISRFESGDSTVFGNDEYSLDG